LLLPFGQQKLKFSYVKITLFSRPKGEKKLNFYPHTNYNNKKIIMTTYLEFIEIFESEMKEFGSDREVELAEKFFDWCEKQPDIIPLISVDVFWLQMRYVGVVETKEMIDKIFKIYEKVNDPHGVILWKILHFRPECERILYHFLRITESKKFDPNFFIDTQSVNNVVEEENLTINDLVYVENTRMYLCSVSAMSLQPSQCIKINNEFPSQKIQLSALLLFAPNYAGLKTIFKKFTLDDMRDIVQYQFERYFGKFSLKE